VINLPFKCVLVLLFSSVCLSANAAVNCSVNSTPVDFRTVPVLSGVTTTAEGEVRVRCVVVGLPPLNNQVSASIRISSGNSLSYTPRQLFNVLGASNSNHKIDYNLFPVASSTSLIWGDGVTTGTTDVVVTLSGLSGDGVSSEISRIIHGRIPSINSGKNPGRYSDLLILTVAY
jgi:hypothetical protein